MRSLLRVFQKRVARGGICEVRGDVHGSILLRRVCRRGCLCILVVLFPWRVSLHFAWWFLQVFLVFGVVVWTCGTGRGKIFWL